MNEQKYWCTICNAITYWALCEYENGNYTYTCDKCKTVLEFEKDDEPIEYVLSKIETKLPELTLFD